MLLPRGPSEATQSLHAVTPHGGEMHTGCSALPRVHQDKSAAGGLVNNTREDFSFKFARVFDTPTTQEEVCSVVAGCRRCTTYRTPSSKLCPCLRPRRAEGGGT